jgi:hypothetical protein
MLISVGNEDKLINVSALTNSDLITIHALRRKQDISLARNYGSYHP